MGVGKNDSLAEAYAADRTLTRKTNFSFAFGYKKGADGLVPFSVPVLVLVQRFRFLPLWGIRSVGGCFLSIHCEWD